MSDNTRPSEIVNVPVPQQHLLVVYRALAEAMEAEEAASLVHVSAAPAPAAGDEGSGGWTLETVAKLKPLVQNPTARMLLDMTAAKPDQWLDFEELMGTANRSYYSARGDLAGLTRLIKRTFGHKAWPLQVELTGNGGHVRYRMHKNVAEWWNAA